MYMYIKIDFWKHKKHKLSLYNVNCFEMICVSIQNVLSYTCLCASNISEVWNRYFINACMKEICKYIFFQANGACTKSMLNGTNPR
jgi:hypothetical protein